MKKKELFVILILIILIVFLLFVKNKENNTEKLDNNIIENEEYYKEKQKELSEYEEKYDNLLSEYIENSFSNEEKEQLKIFDEKILNSDNKDESILCSQQKNDYIENISNNRFTVEQKNKIKEIEDKKNELNVIVREYIDEIKEQEQINFWKEREKLSDGSIVNKRESVISNKICDGLLFTNMEFIYNSEKNKTILSATVKNNSSELKGGYVSLKLTGDINTIFPVKVAILEPGEISHFEIEIDGDSSMAEGLEIIPYNEADYAEFTGNLIQQ